MVSPRDPREGIIPTACPACGYRLDAAMDAAGSDAAPGPGDFTVCFGCGAVLRYTDELGVRLVKEDEIDALYLVDPEQWRLIFDVVRRCREAREGS